MPVIKLTCQIFLTHPVADFCAVGFTPSRIGPRWLHPEGGRDGSRPIGLTPGASDQTNLSDPVTWPHSRRMRWFLAYRPDSWGPVIKLTCQIFLAHPEADFCTLGFAPSRIGPRFLHLGGSRDGSPLIGLPPGGH